MEILSPDDLSAYLIVLKEHGVRRARLDGVGEFEWDAEALEQPEPEIRYVQVPTATKPIEAGHAPESNLPPGYSALFGGTAPKFTPAKG